MAEAQFLDFYNVFMHFDCQQRMLKPAISVVWNFTLCSKYDFGFTVAFVLFRRGLFGMVFMKMIQFGESRFKKTVEPSMHWTIFEENMTIIFFRIFVGHFTIGSV